jgi:hypothetical protein
MKEMAVIFLLVIMVIASFCMSIFSYGVLIKDCVNRYDLGDKKGGIE